jgi:hypothetical protein
MPAIMEIQHRTKHKDRDRGTYEHKLYSHQLFARIENRADENRSANEHNRQDTCSARAERRRCNCWYESKKRQNDSGCERRCTWNEGQGRDREARGRQPNRGSLL